ncbi:MAG: hypothetical protein E7292_12950, partial [Lachnospiraceae bacterium]|nr:hypothetical protein [Lachnospiraceae bacterium]
MTTKEMLEKEQQNNLMLLSKFCLMDDDFMSNVFDDNIELTEFTLRTILGSEDIDVIQVTTQKTQKSAKVKGRGVRLDVYARDKKGRAFNMEVQRERTGASVKRARYNSSMMDVRLLNTGEDFEKLPDAYMVFITEKDVLGQGKALYYIHRKIDGSDAEFIDGSNIIYVNGSYQNDKDPIGKLMHDFHCTDANEMYYPVLANSVRYFKESEGGTKRMCKLMEDRMKEVEERLRPVMREELRPELREELRPELREELRPELREELRP